MLAQEIPPIYRLSLTRGKYQGLFINSDRTDASKYFRRLCPNRDDSRTAVRLRPIKVPVVNRLSYTEHTGLQVKTSPPKRK